VSRIDAVAPDIETVKAENVATPSPAVTAVALASVPEPLETLAVTVTPEVPSETFGAEVNATPLFTEAGCVVIEIRGSLMPPPLAGVNEDDNSE
jgi:hypothetical protein